MCKCQCVCEHRHTYVYLFSHREVCKLLTLLLAPETMQKVQCDVGSTCKHSALSTGWMWLQTLWGAFNLSGASFSSIKQAHWRRQSWNPFSYYILWGLEKSWFTKQICEGPISSPKDLQPEFCMWEDLQPFPFPEGGSAFQHSYWSMTQPAKTPFTLIFLGTCGLQ